MVLSRILYFGGLVLMLHTGYSSYELHHVLKSSNIHEFTLPIDLIIEVVLALGLILGGAMNSLVDQPILSSEKRLIVPENKYLRHIDTRIATREIEKAGMNEYVMLETRVDFIDIKAKRKEFSQYIARKE